MATQVEYFNGTASLGVALQAPYTLKLDNLAVGTYQVTAKITTTDPNNPILRSVPLTVIVGTAPGAAKAYFIDTDQLDTPRAITNAAGDLVWQWDSDPFGKDAPNEQPAGQPAFTFNQRFPGQQFERESILHYNYFRDYDPALGRYIESDPIGLRGGINTYGYVKGNPLSLTDRRGLDFKEQIVDLIRVGLPGVIVGHDLSQVANETARGSGLPGFHNGPADAFKHCLWSCLMTKSAVLGPNEAQMIGDEHEANGNRHGQPKEEEGMDLHNNATGRQCGLFNKKPCQQSCMDALNSGMLWDTTGQSKLPKDFKLE